MRSWMALGVGLGPELGLLGRRRGVRHDLARVGPGACLQQPPDASTSASSASRLGLVGRLELAADLLLALAQGLVEPPAGPSCRDPHHHEEGQEHDDEGPVGDEEVAGWARVTLVILVHSGGGGGSLTDGRARSRVPALGAGRPCHHGRYLPREKTKRAAKTRLMK